MELVDRGTYRYDPQHTPLARMAVALGPYLTGVHSFHYSNMWKEGNAILAANGAYWRNLALARLGTLPFFLVACYAIWAITRKLSDRITAFVATTLFCLLPPVIGHAGLATTDMACTATFLLAVWAFLLWLEEPNPIRSATLGAGVALSLLARLSSIPFIALSFGLILGCFFLKNGRGAKFLPSPGKQRWLSMAAFAGSAVFLVLASYGFSSTPFLDDMEVAQARAASFGHQSDPYIKELQYTLASLPVPSAQFLRGIYSLAQHNRAGHDSYLFGEFRDTGWWYFFPVVLAVKTPVGFLLLALIGVYLLLQGSTGAGWMGAALVLAPIAVLMVSLISRVNLGVRLILPMYPFLSIAAAFAVMALWRAENGQLAKRAVVGLAMLWFLFASIRAYPNDLGYFNEIAGSHPERILSESDLDWGQDLHRLSLRLKELGAHDVKIGYFGSAELSQADLPSYQELTPYTQTSGYVAVSIRELTLEDAKVRAASRGTKEGPYSWLKSYEPFEKVGSSILLYKLQPTPSTTGLQASPSRQPM